MNELVDYRPNVAENLAGVDQSEIQYPTIKVHEEDDLVCFNAEGSMLDKIQAYIIMHHKQNSYWPYKYNKNKTDPPVCFSINGMNPHDTAKEPQSPGCKDCANNQWGSIKLIGGADDENGKACRNSWRLLMSPVMTSSLDPLDCLPSILRLPPSHMQSFTSFLVNATNSGMPIAFLKTSMSFNKTGKIVYQSEPVEAELQDIITQVRAKHIDKFLKLAIPRYDN